MNLFGGQYGNLHKCLACIDKVITWRFAICKDCEKTYGKSSKDWPEWLRFSWKDELRRRRWERRHLLNEGRSYVYEEENGFINDGLDYLVSNRNPDKYLNEEIILEILGELPEIWVEALKLYYIEGYKYWEICEKLGVTRVSIWNWFKMIKMMFSRVV